MLSLGTTFLKYLQSPLRYYFDTSVESFFLTFVLELSHFNEKKYYSMSLTTTPNSDRLHITILGRVNSGKSSLLNTITGQQSAVVSDTAGTTTDVVSKAMELRGIGACLFVDTPGFDDRSILGKQRTEQIHKALERADIAILMCGGDSLTGTPDLSEERTWAARLKEKKIPAVFVVGKTDVRDNTALLVERIKEEFSQTPVCVSADIADSVEHIRLAILEALPEDYRSGSITGDMVRQGDVVLLVMPQDAQAPKGRLILPQVQTIRELLDKKCIVVSCTPDDMQSALAALVSPPQLIITDSQVFGRVYEMKPEGSRLTSFSVLFAGYKGDIRYFVKSALAIDSLTPQSRILIAEACTHAPATEDIGREKIPRMLRQRVGQSLEVDIVSGADFPQDLTPYDLVIHCGSCMFNRKHVLGRVERAVSQGVPMTNYGIAIAHLSGILSKIEY